MAVGRLMAMVGMLVWHRTEGRYLLLRRSPTEDYAPGQWESGSGRLEQGEGFIDALQRESREELGSRRAHRVSPWSHAFLSRRTCAGERDGWGNLGCSVADASDLPLSDEHSEHRWVTAEEAVGFLPPDPWLTALILRGEAFRQLMPVELRRLHWEGDLEF